MMIDALEKRLIEALKTVDAHGDVAPAHVHDPMTMLLRENAIVAKVECIPESAATIAGRVIEAARITPSATVIR